jgi:hypothetical protein
MGTALELFPDDHVCFIDADIEASDRNIPQTLAEGLLSSGADMVIAEFDWPEKTFLANKSGIYDPLVGALFPEALDGLGRTPFSGFRLVDAKAVIGPLPPGFGAELHLNVSFAAAGLRTKVVDIGRYLGPVRDKVEYTADLANAILDHAERLGRLDPELRPLWDRWVASVARVIRTWSAPERSDEVAQFHARVEAAASAPLPPATADLRT